MRIEARSEGKVIVRVKIGDRAKDRVRVRFRARVERQFLLDVCTAHPYEQENPPLYTGT